MRLELVQSVCVTDRKANTLRFVGVWEYDMEKTEQMYDVAAVDQKTGKVRLIAENKKLGSAEAIESMAVLRRGVDTEFFSVVYAGKYKDGDKWLDAT